MSNLEIILCLIVVIEIIVNTKMYLFIKELNDKLAGYKYAVNTHEQCNLNNKRLLASMSKEIEKYAYIERTQNEEFRLMNNELKNCYIEITNLKEALISCQEDLELSEGESDLRLSAINDLGKSLEIERRKLCARCQINTDLNKHTASIFTKFNGTFDGDTQ